MVTYICIYEGVTMVEADSIEEAWEKGEDLAFDLFSSDMDLDLIDVMQA